MGMDTVIFQDFVGAFIESAHVFHGAGVIFLLQFVYLIVAHQRDTLRGLLKYRALPGRSVLLRNISFYFSLPKTLRVYLIFGT